MKHGDVKKKRDAKMSLQKKTLLMFTILMLSFCIVFTIATSIISKRTEEDFKVRTAETAVNNVSSTIKERIVNYNYLSRLIMTDDNVVEYLKAYKVNKEMGNNARDSIAEVISLYSNINSVHIFRNNGKCISTTPGEKDAYVSDIEKSRILTARGGAVLSIKKYGTNPRNKGPSILTLSRAVYDINSQKLIGILIMNISNDVFDDVIELQNTGGMCVLNSDGTILCGDGQTGRLYDPDFNSDQIIYKTVSINGEKKMLAGMVVLDPIVVMCVSGQGAESLPSDIMYALMITMIAFILSTLVCAWFIATNVSRPIKNLSQAMEHTRSSGWLKQIDIKMPNQELNSLEESYNSVIEYLNELFNRLLENEKNVQKAELRVLQEQIKPHFLYNSIETISYLAIQENAGKARDALETLGNFYRNFLSKGDREIPLKRELRIIQDYLSLQKLRYGDIFDDEYMVDEHTLDYKIPKLILQPIVENSIYHGVRLKGEKCIIRITTRLEEEGLHIIVYDSGVGMSEEQIRQVLEAGNEEDEDDLSGFGLRGTINRIRYYCDCDDAVQIRSETGEYTEIEICIPEIIEKTGGENHVSCNGH
ncbi:MAG: histidine kinase [Clostridia bacterium]|nr:histidine kinase [Clostridia bacterium]